MKNRLKILLYVFAFSIFTVALLPAMLNSTPASPAVGNWYQQFLPDLNGATVSDVVFIDSLNGFMAASHTSVNDTCYILKTTSAGDSWVIKHKQRGVFTRVVFINNNTGYTCGSTPGVNELLFKTTNSGDNWSIVNTPNGAVIRDMHILGEDTMWIVHSDILKSIYRTTNGGASWEQQFSDPGPLTKVYMFNSRLGFFSTNTKLYRTTNSGLNWNEVIGARGFFDIYFADSLTGWKANDSMKKTTNGGLNWTRQVLPTGGNISIFSGLYNFSNINKDTIWGVGGTINYPNGSNRGFLYHTTNGGDNWLFQIPDTSFKITGFYDIQFLNKSIGWAFGGLPIAVYRNIHTTNGGDTTFIVGLQQVNTEVPVKYKLFQNYPNPFNPKTNIKYSIMSNVKGEMSNVSLIVYDITGREIAILVNTEQNAGTYLTDWNASGYSSGVYFYKLSVTTGKEVFTETKKMLMVK